MAYQRFLTDNDYLALITEEGLGQLTRGLTSRLAQAEQRAESVIVDYLDQFYDVGSELMKGKMIKDYSNLVVYPSNAYFKKDGKIYQTLTVINALHKPTSVVYWEAVDELALPAEQLFEKNKEILPYLQLKTYAVGDKVSYLGCVYRCLVANGMDFNNIQIPGVTYWKEVATSEWVANTDYKVGDVVSFNDNFYAVIERSDDDDMSIDPENSDVYGLIGDYDQTYDYSAEATDYDYVVSDSKVYIPILNPNADDPELAVNIKEADPRNYNLVNYITSIALYFLHTLVSPTNISQTRIDMYNQAMDWIINASKMKLDPHIPRRINKETQEPKDDWAMASFETNAATQVRNPWFT